MKIEINADEMEAARLAIENELCVRRDQRISILRGNGLCIREMDGESSDVIRMSSTEAIDIAIEAINKLRSVDRATGNGDVMRDNPDQKE